MLLSGHHSIGRTNASVVNLHTNNTDAVEITAGDVKIKINKNPRLLKTIIFFQTLAWKEDKRCREIVPIDYGTSQWSAKPNLCIMV